MHDMLAPPSLPHARRLRGAKKSTVAYSNQYSRFGDSYSFSGSSSGTVIVTASYI
jgi:hypothetical protein